MFNETQRLKLEKELAEWLKGITISEPLAKTPEELSMLEDANENVQ